MVLSPLCVLSISFYEQLTYLLKTRQVNQVNPKCHHHIKVIRFLLGFTSYKLITIDTDSLHNYVTFKENFTSI